MTLKEKTESLVPTAAAILRADRRVWNEKDPIKAKILLRSAMRLRAARRRSLGYVGLESNGAVQIYSA